MAYGVEPEGGERGDARTVPRTGAQAVACGGKGVAKGWSSHIGASSGLFPEWRLRPMKSTKATSCGRCAAIRKAMVPTAHAVPGQSVLPRRMSFRRRR